MNLKKTNYRLLDKKTQFCISKLKVVDIVCDSNDISSETVKVIKIFKWFFCFNVSKVRAFIDVCVYYRIWIMNFFIIAALIYRILKNEKLFVWTKNKKML